MIRVFYPGPQGVMTFAGKLAWHGLVRPQGAPGLPPFCLMVRTLDVLEIGGQHVAPGVDLSLSLLAVVAEMTAADRRRAVDGPPTASGRVLWDPRRDAWPESNALDAERRYLSARPEWPGHLQPHVPGLTAPLVLN